MIPIPSLISKKKIGGDGTAGLFQESKGLVQKIAADEEERHSEDQETMRALTDALKELQRDLREKSQQCQVLQETVAMISDDFIRSERNLLDANLRIERLEFKMQAVTFWDWDNDRDKLKNDHDVDDHDQVQADDADGARKKTSSSSSSSSLSSSNRSYSRSRRQRREQKTLLVSSPDDEHVDSDDDEDNNTSSGNNSSFSSRQERKSKRRLHTTRSSSSSHLHQRDGNDSDSDSSSDSEEENSPPVQEPVADVVKKVVTVAAVITPRQAAFVRVMWERDLAQTQARQLTQMLLEKRVECYYLKDKLSKTTTLVELAYQDDDTDEDISYPFSMLPSSSKNARGLGSGGDGGGGYDLSWLTDDDSTDSSTSSHDDDDYPELSPTEI
jgi:hypothetical protein